MAVLDATIPSDVSRFSLVSPDEESAGYWKVQSDGFNLPDLIGACDFPAVYHPQGDEIAAESDRWLDAHCPDLSPKARKALYVVRSGVLTAFCCPDSAPHRLRAFADYINHIIYIDDRSETLTESEMSIFVDVVMNAFDYDEYTPSGDMPPEDTNCGRLTRE